MVDSGPEAQVSPRRARARGGADLVGREQDIDRAVDSMRTDGVRLVTITGRAGVGKSALAREVVRRLTILDPVGVDEVQLSGRSGSLELAGLVAALGPPTGGEGTRTGPVPAGRTRLVVIDGAEVRHVEVAEQVVSALAGDPDLAVLVTSTVRLGVRGEHLIPLEPLSLPPDGEHRPDRVLSSPAVQLFCERVRAVAPGFELDDRNADDVARICAHLDGLPLGLELAAARCAVVPLSAVRELIETASALDVASGRSIDGQEHHRSVRDAIRWSYDLLDAGAQQLLRALGVFVGNIRWNDMVEVAAPDCDTAALMDRLGALVGAGLVVRPPDDAAVGRSPPALDRPRLRARTGGGGG